jgi:hypothetical protein
MMDKKVEGERVEKSWGGNKKSMEWWKESRYGRKNKRNAVTEGNAVFILDRQRAVDPGSAEKEAEFQYRMGGV